jgi:hypothetical protein
MPSPTEPDSLRSMISQMETLLRQAFAEGHRQGHQEAIDRMLRAAAGGADPRLPLLTPTETTQPPPPSVGAVRMSPPRVGLANAPRQYPYGAVIGMLREAIIGHDNIGISIPQMIAYCRSRGIDVTPNVIRETIKRLRGGEEVERRGGAYFPGPRLAGYTPAPVNGSVIDEDLLSRNTQN